MDNEHRMGRELWRALEKLYDHFSVMGGANAPRGSYGDEHPLLILFVLLLIKQREPQFWEKVMETDGKCLTEHHSEWHEVLPFLSTEAALPVLPDVIGRLENLAQIAPATYQRTMCDVWEHYDGKVREKLLVSREWEQLNLMIHDPRWSDQQTTTSNP